MLQTTRQKAGRLCWVRATGSRPALTLKEAHERNCGNGGFEHVSKRLSVAGLYCAPPLCSPIVIAGDLGANRNTFLPAA